MGILMRVSVSGDGGSVRGEFMRQVCETMRGRNLAMATE